LCASGSDEAPPPCEGVMTMTILGDGPMGRAVASAAAARGEPAVTTGRPQGGRHAAIRFERSTVVVDASTGNAVDANVAASLDAGVRRFVIATTGWAADLDAVTARLRSRGAAAVVASNFSMGVLLFGRLVEAASDLFCTADGFDPYLVGWHRRSKVDRPSGTAIELARRMASRHPRRATTDDLEVVSIRAGSSPGMHLVGFDAVGETIELRLTARDRTAYASGVLMAADWLRDAVREPGIHPFEAVVDDRLRRRPAA
jgi:4-hydroxy-tetrahydrodipicolinate reductase